MLAATSTPCHGTCQTPVARKICGRSFGSRPSAFVRSLGSWPNVRDPGRAIVLNCASDAAALLVTSMPYVFEYVYDPDACHRLEIRFSIATTSPSYLRNRFDGFVSRNRRSAVELVSTQTGTT